VVLQERVSAALAESLRSSLGARLPGYMVPPVFVFLDALPLSPNGKVDRRRLPAPGPSQRQREIAPPRTPTEEALAAIWRELLGHDEIGVGESFFALGGHSLLATQALALVRQTFGVEISLREAFQSPTVAGLAALIDARTAAGRAPGRRRAHALLNHLGRLSDDEAADRFAVSAVLLEIPTTSPPVDRAGQIGLHGEASQGSPVREIDALLARVCPC